MLSSRCTVPSLSLCCLVSTGHTAPGKETFEILISRSTYLRILYIQSHSYVLHRTLNLRARLIGSALILLYRPVSLCSLVLTGHTAPGKEADLHSLVNAHTHWARNCLEFCFISHRVCTFTSFTKNIALLVLVPFPEPNYSALKTCLTLRIVTSIWIFEH